MLFSTKVVGVNKRIIKMLRMCGIGFLLFLLFLMNNFLQPYAIYIFLIIIGLVIYNSIFIKGEASIHEMKDDLNVTEEQFEIGKIIFPFSDLNKIKFEFESYNGMEQNSYERYDPLTQLKRADSSMDGMRNYLSFKYKNQSFEYRFYVGSQTHFYQFVQMLQELYIHHIPFAEENWYGKTFLMQNVSEEDYQLLIQKFS